MCLCVFVHLFCFLFATQWLQRKFSIQIVDSNTKQIGGVNDNNNVQTLVHILQLCCCQKTMTVALLRCCLFNDLPKCGNSWQFLTIIKNQRNQRSGRVVVVQFMLAIIGKTTSKKGKENVTQPRGEMNLNLNFVE